MLAVTLPAPQPFPIDLVIDHAEHLLVERLQRSRAAQARTAGRFVEAEAREERAVGLVVDAGWLGLIASRSLS